MIDNNNASLNEYFIGTVVNYDAKTKEVAVTIPRLMPMMDETTKQDNEVKTNTNSLINPDIIYQDKIKTSNYIWVKSLDISDAVADIGSKVRVRFLDGNPQFGYWSPFNIKEGFYKEVADTKNVRLFKLTIAGQTINVNEGDSIDIAIPERIAVSTRKENGVTYIDLVEDDLINNLVSKVEFMESSVEELVSQATSTEISKLNAIAVANDNSEGKKLLKELKAKVYATLTDDNLRSTSTMIKELNNTITVVNTTWSNYLTLTTKYESLPNKSLIKQKGITVSDAAKLSTYYNVFIDNIRHSKSNDTTLKNFDTTKRIVYYDEGNVIYIVDREIYDVIYQPEDSDMIDLDLLAEVENTYTKIFKGWKYRKEQVAFEKTDLIANDGVLDSDYAYINFDLEPEGSDIKVIPSFTNGEGITASFDKTEYSTDGTTFKTAANNIVPTTTEVKSIRVTYTIDGVKVSHTKTAN